MSDIFLSYASEDRDRVRPLVEELERQGWSVWWDRTLYAGPRFDDEIERALDAARCVVVVWSEHAVHSNWVRNEANEGLKRGILVPASLDAATPPLAFRHNQTAHLMGWPEADGQLDQLLAGIRAACGGEGHAPPVTAPRRRRHARSQLRKWGLGVAIALAVIVAAVRVARHGLSKQSAATRTVVFTFTTPSGDVGAAGLAGTIANEVVETMGAMGIPVLARSGVESISGPERAARLHELGADYAVDGEIHRDAAGLLVSARIDSLATNRTLWSNSYRGSDTNTLRRQIATQLTDTLRCASSDAGAIGIGSFGIPGDDPDSLSILLRACSMVRLARNDENRALFRSLVQRYPDSPALNASLAVSIINSLAVAPPTARAALLSEARIAVDRALALDPSAPAVYVAAYAVRVAEGGPPAELQALLVRGLEGAPEHATLNAFYGEFLQNTGRITDAEPYLRRGVAGDPLSSAKPFMLALNLAASTQFHESDRVLRQAVMRWPDDRYLWQLRMHLATFYDVGYFDGVLALVPPTIDGAGATACWRALAAAHSQTDLASKRRLGADATSQCLDGKFIGDGEAIGIAALFGNIDDAFAQAERFTDWRELLGAPLFVPEASAMHRDARFLELMHRLGFVEFWKQSGQWPDFCRLPDLPYDCRAAEIATPPARA